MQEEVGGGGRIRGYEAGGWKIQFPRDLVEYTNIIYENIFIIDRTPQQGQI